MIKKWINSASELPENINTYEEAIEQLNLTADSILKGFSNTISGQKIFIVTPLSKNINSEKRSELFPSVDEPIYESRFEIKKLVASCDEYQLYLDRSLMYRSEYYVLNWKERLLYRVSLAELVNGFNFFAWIDIVD